MNRALSEQQPEPLGGVRGRRAWRIAVWSVLAVASGSIVLCPRHWQLVVLTAAGAGSAALAALAAPSGARRSVTAWRCLALGLACFAVADALHATQTWTHGPAALRSSAHVVNLLGYLACLGGVLLLRPRSRSADPTVKYDLAVLAAGLYTAIDVAVLDPAAGRHRVRFALLFAVGHPLLDLALLVAVIAVALSYHRLSAAQRAVLLASLLLLGANIANSVLHTAGRFSAWVSLAYAAAYLAVAGAAALCSHTELVRGDTPPAASLRRLGLLGLGMMALVVSVLLRFQLAGRIDVLETGLVATCMVVMMLRRLNLTIAAERAARREVEAQHHFDPVAQCGNRYLLISRLDEMLAAAGPDEPRLVLLLGDLNRFQDINDSHGHAAGDQLLRVVANRLRAGCPPPALVTRLGGDEFAVLLPEPAVLSLADEVIALARQVSTPALIDGREIVPTISFGVVRLEPTDTREEALWKADMAMYAAKRRDAPAVVYDDDLDNSARRRQTLQNDLRTAVGDGTLQLVYQPVVRDRAGSVVGCEALVRWHHPRYGTVSPVEFIPLAEHTGAINDIGRWVLLEACREAASWPVERQASVAVNVSPTQLKSPSFVRDVGAALRATGLEPHRLILEITEAVFLDPASTLRVLTALKGLGLRLAVDDFGTGYSSLSYLQQLPLDQLKIDRSFVSRLHEPDSAALVKMLIALARTLGLEVVAEGVETMEQAAWLTEQGELKMQGYLFSPPVSPQVLPTRLVRALVGDPALSSTS